jgi:hypothetical protein
MVRKNELLTLYATRFKANQKCFPTLTEMEVIALPRGSSKNKLLSIASHNM